MVKPDTKLQIPLTKKFKRDFDKKCEAMGFYSSNDVVRFLMQNFISGQIGVVTNSYHVNNFVDQEYVEQLTGEAEESFGRALEDVKHGRTYKLDMNKPNARKSLEKLLED